MSKSDWVSDAGYNRLVMNTGLLHSLLTWFKATLAAFRSVKFSSICYTFLMFPLADVLNTTVRPLFRYSSVEVMFRHRILTREKCSSKSHLVISVFSHLLTCCLQPFLKNSLSLCCSKTSWQKKHTTSNVLHCVCIGRVLLSNLEKGSGRKAR